MSDQVPVIEATPVPKTEAVKRAAGKEIKPQETSSHIAVRPLYSPADLAAWDYNRDVGYPGEFPYTRGVQATMYRGRLWTMRQYAGMGDAEESAPPSRNWMGFLRWR